MDFTKLQAYELIKEESLKDIHSHGYLFRHKKSGARVMYIENPDENKVFNIAFRTPPANSTGVAHILEHSVLCGSKNFPLKDPFVELVKGSLNTFLNAMTYPDKTMYPVASCNDKDFHNLMHVYLDAVFYPNIYQKEEIFRQEGWHYELEAPEKELTYNGVVYNEMKGAFSSPDEVLEREIMNSLFPDNTYGYESGGDPECIPDLTYEEFLDFHRSYYHPSNSYIYFFGNMDIEKELEFLDQEYLQNFEIRQVDSEIQLQESFPEIKQKVLAYPVAEGEPLEDNAYLSWNLVMKDSQDTKLKIAMEILDYALLSAPGAPLKQALLDAQIGKDIYGSYDDGIRQPYFSIIAKGADEKDQERFVAVIRDTLEKIAVQGIDKKAVEAGINYYEFRYREADFSGYPKGLMYGIDVFSSWLYSEEQPFDALMCLDIYDTLKTELKKGYFEQIIQKYFLDNTHGSVLTAVPEKGLTGKREEKLREMLEEKKAQLSEAEVQAYIQNTRELKEYQEAPESKEALECIPRLAREDIKREAGKLYNEVLSIDENRFLYHPVETNGIGYLTLYFDLKNVPEELVPYIGLLKSVLGNIDTEEHAYGELFNEINARTGGILWGTEVFSHIEDTEKCQCMLGIKCKSLYGQIPFLFQMIQEVITKSKLEDKKRLKEIIQQIQARLQAAIPSAGHSSAVLRATSYASANGRFQEKTGGIDFYRFVTELAENFENRVQEITEHLKAMMKMIFQPENLMVSFTGEKAQCQVIEQEVRALKAVLPTESFQKQDMTFRKNVKNEGFKTAGQVQYVAQTGNFSKAGYAYTGALEILKVILSYDYLWNNVRVKGGAYGCMSGFKRNGESYFVSYRDPKLRQTLEIYQGIPEYLEQFQADEDEMTKYIIGTISGRDVPKTPKMQGEISTGAYMRQLSEEMLQKTRNEILDANVEDIRALAPVIRAILSDGDLCVIGNEEMIEREADLFENIEKL